MKKIVVPSFVLHHDYATLVAFILDAVKNNRASLRYVAKYLNEARGREAAPFSEYDLEYYIGEMVRDIDMPLDDMPTDYARRL